MHKVSFSRTLYSSVLLLVLLPLLLLSAVMLYKFYNTTLVQASNAIQWHARNNASKVEQFLFLRRQSAIGFSRTKAIVQLPVNIIFSQFALSELQQYVQENESIRAALVLDTDGFVVEGYPVAALNIGPGYFRDMVNLTLSKKDVVADVHVFNDPDVVSLFAEDKQEEKGYFALVTPLIQEMDSLTTPVRVTGATVIMIPFSEAIRWLEKNKDSEGSTRTSFYQMLLGNTPIYGDHAEDERRTLVQQEKVADVYMHGLRKALIFKVSEDRKAHLAAVNQSLVFASVLMLFLILICVLLARWMTRRLNTPVARIAQMSQAFHAGDYRRQAEDFDFTEFQEIASSLNAMAQTIEQQINSLEMEKERAETSERLKGRFLANVSHEIRTPMNGIFGFLQMLRHSDLNAEQSDYVRQIRTCGEILLTVINDVLDFSKIEANKIELDLQPCDMKQLLSDVIALFRSTAKEKGVEIELVTDETLPDGALCDPVRLKQILVNLLSNAVKFTQQGQISLTVSYNGKGAEGPCWYFAVRDSGIGIAANKLGVLFQPFVQAEGSTTREFGGTGLGLSICKGLTELMQGRIEVESELGKGSCFTVCVPLAETHLISSSEAPEAMQSEFDASGRLVLVVEDNPLNQLVIGKFLEQLGVCYELAQNGAEACEKAADKRYDLILMDIQMPVMDGLSASRQLLEREGFDTPIVAVSANAMVQDIEQAHAMGMRDHLAKPIELDKLRAILARWL